MKKSSQPKSFRRFRPGLLLFAALAAVSCSGGLSPVSLRCEYMEEPVLDIPAPRLSWINEPVSEKAASGAFQSGYEILVASSRELLDKDEGDVWTVSAESPESHLIPYGGAPLESGRDYWWKVRVKDGKGRLSKWSGAALWHTGLLSPDEWEAQWIGAPWTGEKADAGYFPAPEFRKDVTLGRTPVRAKAFVTGLGYFEFYVNGSRIGDDLLVPAMTDYTSRDNLMTRPLSLESRFRGYRTMYLVYDLTGLLSEGDNSVGAIVGGGFFDVDHLNRKAAGYGTPRFICQIELTYDDGSRELVCSDTSWKVRESAIRMNDIYDGEVYDARFEDCPWQDAVTRTAPEGALTTNTAPTDKVTSTYVPLSVEEREDGSFRVLFPETISGRVSFKDISGAPGDTLDVYFPGEEKNGVCKYVFKDGGKVSFAPRFCWYVFDEAIVSGIASLSADQIVAEAVNTDVSVNSEFEASNPLFEKINRSWILTQKDNMHGAVASDCPHRERLPYTGDGQIAMGTVLSNFDAAAFYNKWIADMRLAQDPLTGYVPNGAPWEPYCGGGVAWGAAINVMPWEFYCRYGDVKMLEDSYFAMTEYIRYLLSWRLPDGTILQRRTNPGQSEPLKYFNLGDWSPSYELPDDALVHTFYLWYCLRNTARAAGVLSLEEDRAKWEALASEVREAFIARFYDPDGKTFGDYGSNVFALVTGLDEGMKEDVVGTLRNELEIKYSRHLNTGMLATRFLFETLAENGMNDLAYDIMCQRDVPSFGYWTDNGTTIWEFWNNPRHSHVHPMFGGGLTWFYKCLAGVDTDPAEPAFRHVIVKPVPAKGLDRVYYSTISPYGKVASEVRYSASGSSIKVTVPPGCHATVYVPSPEGGTARTEELGPGTHKIRF